MRICLVGDFTGNPDEGLKNIAIYLSKALIDAGHEVHRANVNQVTNLNFYREIHAFDPDTVHYVPGIGWKNLLLTETLGRATGATKAISAVNPEVTETPLWLAHLATPDIVFTQEPSVESRLDDLGIPYVRVPNGVDTDRFRPFDDDERRVARERFGIKDEAFVALHVGHLTEKRNLEVLLNLQGTGIQVVIAASDFFEADDALLSKLEDAGCLLLEGYIEDVEQLYGAADCYVFPTVAGDTIQMPLSVLEAMACDLPVVTREHHGITTALDISGGLYVEPSDAALVNRVQTLDDNQNTADVNTRDKIAPYAWAEIAETIAEGYREVRR